MKQKTVIHNGRSFRVFTVKAFGNDTDVIVVPQSYQMDGSLALEVLEVEEGRVTDRFGMLTSNIGSPSQGLTDAFVKTYSENSGWALGLARRIGTDTGRMESKGKVTFPLFHFDLDKCYAPA